MAKQTPALTPLESRLMRILWQRGPSTVAGVREALTPPLAYTTVQTMLNILERKGHLRRELDGRAYVYHAVVSQSHARGQALRDLLERLFGGSSEELVMTLVRQRDLDPETLARLAEQLEREGEGGPEQ